MTPPFQAAKGVFGVPYFVYGENRFWGNDRLDLLLAMISKDSGRTVMAAAPRL